MVTAVGWLQSADPITAAEAVRVAERAFAAAEVDGADVAAKAEAGRYPAEGGRGSTAVWKTFAEVDGGTVELWLSRSDAEPVFLDDRTADGTSQLLTDAQFEALADHYDNPAVDRQVRRNLALTLAAALVALVGVTLARDPLALHRPTRQEQP